ncbi:MAG: flagellar hook-length control protein FliK [Terriglobales bacterium]
MSLPKLATHAMPAKTFLPDAGSTRGKFSTVFAGAQDGADGSIPDAPSDRGNHTAKKSSAKSEKSEKSALKVSAGNDGSISRKPAIPNPFSGEFKVEPLNITRPFSQDGSSHTPLTEDSGEARAPRFTTGLAAKSPGSPALSVSGDVHPANTVTENPPAAISSTNLLGTWMARPEHTGFNSLPVSAAARQEASAAPNGAESVTAGAKAVSGSTTHSTTVVSDRVAHTGFTFLPSHATTPAQAPTSTAQSHADPETRREVVQAHLPTGSAASRQEKMAAQPSSESGKKDSDGGHDEAPSLVKAKSLSPTTAPSEGKNSESFAAAAGSVVSMHVSTPDAGNHAGGLSKAPAAPAHAPAVITAEDAEAPVQATVHGTGSLHTAKLVASMERSELRMGLRTGEFGNVDIRTSLVRNQFTAEISAERGELGRALAAELPGLQHRLTEQHLPAANITVQDNSGGGAPESRQGSQQGTSAPVAVETGRHASQDSVSPVLPVEAVEATARLDVHM